MPRHGTARHDVAQMEAQTKSVHNLVESILTELNGGVPPPKPPQPDAGEAAQRCFGAARAHTRTQRDHALATRRHIAPAGRPCWHAAAPLEPRPGHCKLLGAAARPAPQGWAGGGGGGGGVCVYVCVCGGGHAASTVAHQPCVHQLSVSWHQHATCSVGRLLRAGVFKAGKPRRDSHGVMEYTRAAPRPSDGGGGGILMNGASLGYGYSINTHNKGEHRNSFSVPRVQRNSVSFASSKDAAARRNTAF